MIAKFFGSLFAELHEDEAIELRAFQGSVQRWWVRSSEEIAAIVANHPNNLYFGVNPRRVGGGGTNEDVSRIVAVVVDLDSKTVSDPLAAVSDYALAPSALVRSGGGLHAYWFVRDSGSDTEEFKEARKAFLKGGSSDAVHDAARVLRVPGTFNTKYNEPRPVEIVSLAPDVRYPKVLFGKIPKIDVALRRRIYDGNHDGYKSRSERDWAILVSLVSQDWTDDEITALFKHSASGTRYRDRWPDTLHYDIGKVREKVQVSTSGGDSRFEVRGNTVWASRGSKRWQVATFVFTPEALLEGDAGSEDVITGSIIADGTNYKWEHVQIPRGAFVDRKSLTKCLPVAAWSFLGGDDDAVNLLPYYVKQLQDAGVPKLHTVKSVGRHGTGWVTPTNVLTGVGVQTFIEARYAYLNRHQEKPEVTYQLTPPSTFAPVLQEFFDLLPQINEPEVIWLIFSWMVAAMYKPLLGPGGREFPFLQVVGTMGAGKTSTLKNVFLPLCGYTAPRGYSCDTTDFVMMALMASATSIPVFFTEFRSTLPGIDRFLRRLRLSYDTGFDARGRPDQRTINYELCAPLIVDGENPADEPALRERCVMATMRRDALNDTRRLAFGRMSDLPLGLLAAPLVQWTLNHEPPMDISARTVAATIRRSVPDRVRRNLTKVAAGYETIKNIANEYHCTPPLISFAQVATPWLDSILLGETGRTEVLIDEFITDIVNTVSRTGIGYAAQGKGDIFSHVEPFIWRYDQKANIIGFHLASALNWWVQYRRQRSLPTLATTTTKTQLRERTSDPPMPGQYVLGSGSFWTAGGTVMLYQISLDAARETGLDIPQIMSLIGVRGSG